MEVVNKRTHAPTPRDVYIGRPSVFGNPYRIGPGGDRAAVIEKYRRWLIERDDDPRRRAALAAIRALPDDAILVCWCHPLPCHGDVIITIHERLKSPGEPAGGVQ